VRELHADSETQAWLRSCTSRPWANACAAAAAVVLRLCMSVTDSNALLRRGDRFVLSAAQVRALLSGDGDGGGGGGGDGGGAGVAAAAGAPARAPAPALRLGRLLDVGAGDGGVTAVLAAHFACVHATEVSAPMVARLRERGFARVVQGAFLTRDAFPDDGVYDVVSILNVLDRCDHPGELLAAARRLLAPDGRLLLAVVLPFSEFVEEGTARRRVHGPLPMAGARCGDGATFEASLAALVERALTPAGFQVVSVSKVPYLCRGDMRRNYYLLADAIIVARRSRNAPASAQGADAATGNNGAIALRFAGADAARSDVERAALLPALPAARSRDH
jgi:SAM-dependent methyltransferase